MSSILKAILGDWNAIKLRDIFERAKTMDTWEIYDDLFGMPPPLPTPACERLQYLEPWPLWRCGLIWSNMVEGPRPSRYYAHEMGNMELMLAGLKESRPDYSALMPLTAGISKSIGILDRFMVQDREPWGIGYNRGYFDEMTTPPTWDLESWRNACDKAIQSMSNLAYADFQSSISLSTWVTPTFARDWLRTIRRNRRRPPKTRIPFIKSKTPITYAFQNR